jgi:cell wall assembly regulator SMI1
MIQFKNPNTPLGVDAINALEVFLKAKLPVDYRGFLLSCDGGDGPKFNLFKVETGEGSVLRSLFSAQVIPNEVRRLRDELDPDLIPIGDDIGGNRICLAIRGESKGQIFFIDHELDIEEDTGYVPVFFVARSFEEFAATLTKDADPVYGEIEQMGQHGTKDSLVSFLAAGNNLESKNEYGRTVIQEAARYGNIHLIEVCHQMGCGLTGLIHFAAMNRHLHVVDYLIARGIDVNELDGDRKTPLACVWSNEFAQLLKTRGAV